jgi:hypothetical protein
MFEAKIAETEGIVQAIVENKDSGKPQNLREMKAKIFEVCKLIYDEQRIAGA